MTSRFSRRLRLYTLMALFPALSLSLGARAKEFRFLAVGYSAELIDYLNKSVVPGFEARHKVQVTVESTDWNGRMDKILVSIAGGVPYDVVVTGFYSPYEEGSQGLLAPLDGYLAQWQKTSSFPKPLWEALKWNGRTYVVPQNNDLRGMAYNKALFAEAGLDPEHPPQSWDDLIRSARRLTRLEGDRVAVRGINLSRSESGSAQQFFWFMRQAGITEIDTKSFISNLSRPEAVSALRTLYELAEAAQLRTAAVSGGFTQRRVAMEPQASAARARVLEENPDLIEDYGLFPPRESPKSAPVAHGFVNGLGILAASPNKDLAWEFIASLNADDVLFQIERVGGFLSGRVDMARRMMSISPKIDLFYNLFTYLQATVIPPPRNIAQQEIGRRIQQVYDAQLSPQEALMQGDALWNRLLNEWRAKIGR